MKRDSRLIVLTLLGVYLCASWALGKAPLRSVSPSDYAIVQAIRDSISADSIRRSKVATLGDTTLARTTAGASTTITRDSTDAMRSTGSAHPSDSLTADTTKSGQLNLTQTVHFESNDSTVAFPKSNLVRMFGNASVKYGQQTLHGDYMDMRTDSGIVYSTYIDYPDSLEREKIYAKIEDGQENYEAKSITYNFNSRRGYITDVITQQGEGYITAEKTKRMENEDMYMEDGKYTTCDNHEHPHFYIALTKAKVRPKKNLVSGPIYLVFADVPIPLGLPFAFFPFTQSRASGIIPPTYGDEMERGFYLRNGGYYFAINDYVDFELTGDIYTKGSWGLSGQSRYRKRYRYSGGFNASYLVTVRGDKIAGDYSKSTDFRIAWNHQQDPKANPYRTFTANVNFSTSSYNHNNLDGLYNQAVLGQNTKSSSVSFSQSFPNTPFRISGSLDITQRSRDSAIAITAPNLSITMSRIFPFKRKKQVGKERWYEKISMSYSGQVRNSIDTKENLVLKSNIVRDWRNGMSHNIPVSASFDLFNYFKITPSFNYQERWYSSRIRRAYDPVTNRVEPVDTTYGFNRVYDYNAALSLSTTVYGFWKPLKWVPWLGKNVEMIRHRVEPQFSLSYRPDFGAPRYGYWEELPYINAVGERQIIHYSPYEGQLFGVPGQGKSGSISMSVNNNIEAKIRAKGDSVEARKISIIDGLSFSTSYNMAADSFQWSDLSASLRLRLSQNFTLNLSGAFDLYTYDYYERDGRIYPYRVDKLRVVTGKGIGRLRGTSTSFSYQLNPTTFDKLLVAVGLKKKSDEKKDPGSEDRLGTNNMYPGNSPSETPEPGSGLADQEGGGRGSLFASQDQALGEYDANGYLINKIGWNLGFSYSMSLGQGEFDTRIKEFKYRLNHDLSFNGQLTPTKNWNFNFSANYNFELGKVTNMTCNITRNLHCWTMTASFIPLGPYKSYNFSIAVNSSMLSDLKYRQSSTPRFNSAEQWY